ncbi:LOW QUALITY PROTEIN: hypothetical protein V1477_012112 [Vespula maculifrons]|uniref:Uncharacterized protein n=1 Tax=Vespula maculifrons TaxID=7453 RepID=A0ABD2BWK3_VESMC
MKGHLILIPKLYTRDDHAIALETLDLDRNEMHSCISRHHPLVGLPTTYDFSEIRPIARPTAIGESAFTRLAYRRHPPVFDGKRNRRGTSRRKKLSPLTPKSIFDSKENFSSSRSFVGSLGEKEKDGIYKSHRDENEKRVERTFEKAVPNDEARQKAIVKNLLGGKYENERIFQASNRVCPLFHSLWNVESFPSVEAAATTVKEQRRKKGYEESGATCSVAALSKVEQVYRMSLVPCILASKPSSTRFGISLLPGKNVGAFSKTLGIILPSHLRTITSPVRRVCEFPASCSSEGEQVQAQSHRNIACVPYASLV